MSNRIKEFRKQQNLTQNELTEKLNKLLVQKGRKTVTQATLSRWEKGINIPLKESWDVLSEALNIPVLQLQGAYSKEEILKMLQEAYKKKPHVIYPINYDRVRNEISFNVDLVMIAHGYIEPNEPYINGMLSESDVNNFEFWKQNFSFIFESVAVRWLISRPIEVPDDEILKAINEAIQTELSKLATDTRERQDKDGYWLESPSKYLSKRQEFINEHITQDNTLEF